MVRFGFFGEPADKVRGSKPIHAAADYYDGLAGMASFIRAACYRCRIPSVGILTAVPASAVFLPSNA